MFCHNGDNLQLDGFGFVIGCGITGLYVSSVNSNAVIGHAPDALIYEDMNIEES